MVTKPKVRTKHRRPAGHSPHPKLLAQRFAEPADVCQHCNGTTDCPSCAGDPDGCIQCTPFRAGSCSACDGTGEER